jgi:hypothetical protein
MRRWEGVSLAGRILFNLNIFSSNQACKALYWRIGAAQLSERLAKSDGTAHQVGPVCSAL